MIRVLFVAHSGSMSGGANRSLLSLIVMLREKYGISPSVLIPEADSELEEICKEINIDVYHARYHSCCTVYRHDAKDGIRLLKLLIAPEIDRIYARRFARSLLPEFDLIYTNDRMIIIGAYIARIMKIPHIWHVRCSEMKHGTRFPPKWYARMRNHANRIVLISKALQDQFSRHVPENQIRVIYNGLEVDKYLIQDRTEHAGFHILLCGHLIAQKGHIDVLRAMNILNNRYGIPARLFIAGRRPSYESEHYLGELQKYIKENNLESSVTFLGEIRDMRTIRKQMDAEVVCGRLEAFGRVTVEAMLAELPVVGAISGCTPEIVQDGITGLLYPVEQADVLAEKLYWLYAHPEERREMGRRGKERAMNAFTIEKTARQVESLIAEVIAENKNAQ